MKYIYKCISISVNILFYTCILTFPLFLIKLNQISGVDGWSTKSNFISLQMLYFFLNPKQTQMPYKLDRHRSRALRRLPPPELVFFQINQKIRFKFLSDCIIIYFKPCEMNIWPLMHIYMHNNQQTSTDTQGKHYTPLHVLRWRGYKK